MISTKEDILLIEETIKQASQNGQLDNREIWVFGCIVSLRDIKSKVEEYGYKISGIVDNNIEIHGKLCLGLTIQSPDQLRDKSDCIIIVCSVHWYEMIGQLHRLGIGESQIICIRIEASCWYLLKDKGFEKNRERIEAGYARYKQIISSNRRDAFVFLCPYPGTGDVYMACSFLGEYAKKNNIEKYCLTVIGRQGEKVAALFGISDVEVVTEEEMNDIVDAWQFLGNEKMQVKPLLFWKWRTKRAINEKKLTGYTFTDCFRYDVYDLDSSVEMVRPNSSSDSYEEVKQIFEENGLKKGKTVIIAPYAGSFIASISDSEWEEFVDGLKRNGFSAVTNCFGKEKPIKGTIPIQFPYIIAIPMVEYAGYFIGLRSGLCDIISSANAVEVILYENGFAAVNKHFFGLNEMGLNLNANEIIYDKTTSGAFWKTVNSLFGIA